MNKNDEQSCTLANTMAIYGRGVHARNEIDLLMGILLNRWGYLFFSGESFFGLHHWVPTNWLTMYPLSVYEDVFVHLY